MKSYESAENEIQDNELQTISRMAKKQDAQSKLYLHYAVKHGDIELVIYLLACGESALQMDDQEVTPLQLASKERYGEGYDIFILLLKSAQEEVKNYSDGRVCPQLITDCAEKFSKPLLMRLEDYLDEILQRNKFIKFMSVIFGKDKTLDRNREQAAFLQGLSRAEKTRDYFSLYNMIDREYDTDESSLHKKLEESKQDGKKIFRDYEHVMRFKDALIEYHKQKPLSLNQRMIKKLNKNVIENKRLTKENGEVKIENSKIKSTLEKQEIKIENLETQVNALSLNVQQLSELIINSNILTHKKERARKKEEPKNSSVWATLFDSDEKPVKQAAQKSRSYPSTPTSGRK